MSSDVVYSAIKNFLTAIWTAVPLVFENENYDLPDDPSPYVYVEISGNLYAQQSIGATSSVSNLWREQGLLWIHVFVPSGTGSLLARQYAKQIADLFRGKELLSGKLIFRDISIGMGQTADEDGNYWRLSVSIEWQNDN
jgi:hypothetical protein